MWQEDQTINKMSRINDEKDIEIGNRRKTNIKDIF